MAKLGETTFGTEILSKAEIERGFVGKSASLVENVSRLADGCSADDIRDMVNKLAAILCSMHGKALSLLLALAASVLTMPAGADAGLSVVSNRLGSVGLNQYVVTSVAQAPRRYALFVVPLNDYRSDASASPWNGFELKASTNNFSEAVDSAAVLPTKAADAASVAPDSVAASGAACAVAVTAQPVAASASTRAVSVPAQPASAAVSSPRVEIDVIDLLLSSGEFASRLGVIRRLIQLRRARGEDESDLRALVTRILSGSR